MPIAPDVLGPAGKFGSDVLAEPDPHKRSRAYYGDFPGAVNLAVRGSHELLQSAWVHDDLTKRRAIIELWWYREPTPEERTETARAAAQAFLDWHGTPREWWESLRVRKGRERPPDGKRRLPALEP
ncbi:MAG TPA: hypothetical protein VGK73_08790 [Polyangiaceae bacterium]